MCEVCREEAVGLPPEVKGRIRYGAPLFDDSTGQLLPISPEQHIMMRLLLLGSDGGGSGLRRQSRPLMIRAVPESSDGVCFTLHT